MARIVNIRNSKVLVTQLQEAKHLKTRLVGLMGRKNFLDGEGLLIHRSGNSIHTFFMKFPIDLLFVNSKREVKYVARNVQPWRLIFAPLLLPTDCLELPAGVAEKTDTQIGDILRVEA